MRLNLSPVITHALRMALSIRCKSWHYAVRSAHDCLCAMPDPAWYEAEPGLSWATSVERDANSALNGLRAQVMLWLVQLIDPRKSWESSDSWPEPQRLRDAIEALRRFAPPDDNEPVDSTSTEQPTHSSTDQCSQPDEVQTLEHFRFTEDSIAFKFTPTVAIVNDHEWLGNGFWQCIAKGNGTDGMCGFIVQPGHRGHRCTHRSEMYTEKPDCFTEDPESLPAST